MVGQARLCSSLTASSFLAGDDACVCRQKDRERYSQQVKEEPNWRLSGCCTSETHRIALFLMRSFRFAGLKSSSEDYREKAEWVGSEVEVIERGKTDVVPMRIVLNWTLSLLVRRPHYSVME
jgi:hypothetical protein